MSDKCDSTHEGNGRPGNGIMFQAATKLLLAVSALMDTCGEPGIDSSRALAAVKRRENQLIDASARHDAKVSALRERLSAANAKLAEMARLAEDSAKAAQELTACDEPCVWKINRSGWIAPQCEEAENIGAAWHHSHLRHMTYCPHCGRKIREADDGDDA